jgi:hypothetical protein
LKFRNEIWFTFFVGLLQKFHHEGTTLDYKWARQSTNKFLESFFVDFRERKEVSNKVVL